MPREQDVKFPAMRADVIDALTALADRVYQEQCWGVYDEARNTYDDLTMNVNILYDCRVLPEARNAVGSVIHAAEEQSLRCLGVILDRMIEDLGNAPDADYLSDPRWPDVVVAARSALERMSVCSP